MKIILTIALIFCYVSFARSASLESNETMATRSTIAMLKTAIKNFKKQYGTYPSTDIPVLFQVLQGADMQGSNPLKLHFIELPKDQFSKGILLDGWNRPFVFKSDLKKDILKIWSLGKDGVFDETKASKAFIYSQLIPQEAEQDAAANP